LGHDHIRSRGRSIPDRHRADEDGECSDSYVSLHGILYYKLVRSRHDATALADAGVNDQNE